MTILPQTPPAFGETLEVAPGVLWARIALPFRLDHVNIYFLADHDGTWAIYDTGIDNAHARAQWLALLEGPMKGARFSRLICSHGHPDHIGLAGWLCQTLDIPLQTTRISFLSSTMIANGPEMMASPDYAQLYFRHGMDLRTSQAVATRGHEYLSMISALPLSYTRLHLNQTLTLGDRHFEVIAAEGHCLGQVMLYDRANALLLAADHLIERISPNVSVQPWEPFEDPLGEFLTGQKAVLRDIEERVLTLSGHHMPFMDPHRRAAEMIAHHHKRLEMILEALAQGPKSTAEIVPKLFERALTAHEMSFAFTEVLAHINHLVARGSVRWQQDGQQMILAARI